MALTTAVMVGDANKWLPEVAERAAKLRISAGIIFVCIFYSTKDPRDVPCLKNARLIFLFECTNMYF